MKLHEVKLTTLNLSATLTKSNVKYNVNLFSVNKCISKLFWVNPNQTRGILASPPPSHPLPPSPTTKLFLITFQPDIQLTWNFMTFPKIYLWEFWQKTFLKSKVTWSYRHPLKIFGRKFGNRTVVYIYIFKATKAIQTLCI